METKSRNGVVGAVMVGAGVGLAAAGAVLLLPICTAWSRTKLRQVVEKGKLGVIAGFETAANALGEVASRAEHPLGEAAKAAKQTTAIAAGAIESAAHYVRERIQ